MPAPRRPPRPTHRTHTNRGAARAPAWHRTALLALLSVAVASCAALVGFEDAYEVAPATEPTTGGQGGAGGTGPTTGGDGGTGGSGGAPVACEHDVCVGGPPLTPGCDDPCAKTICESDAYCCGDMDGYWDATCVEHAVAMCDADCCGDGLCMGPGNTCTGCAEDCGDCGCAHSVCETGAALSEAACRGPECTTKVCAQMPECCNGFYSWTAECLGLAGTLCDGADSCVGLVCDELPQCCSVEWTNQCVNAATALCSTDCDCKDDFDLCTGQDDPDPPVADCDPCVTAVCDADSVCCGTGWDSFCATEASVICGIACP